MPTIVPTARGLYMYDQAGLWQRDSVVLSLYAMCAPTYHSVGV